MTHDTGASLGDILQKAIHQTKKERKMENQMIIIARLKFFPGQKIEAIKLLREAVECGLANAKKAVEDAEFAGVLIRVTAEQFGRLTALIQTNIKREAIGLEVAAEAIEVPELQPKFDFLKV